MKIYINREPIFAPWGGGAKLVNELYRLIPEFGHEIIDPISNKVPDIILCTGTGPEGRGIGINQALAYKNVNPNVKVILRVNENDAHKGTSTVDDNLINLSKHLDGSIFVSQYMTNYFKHDRSWFCNNTEIINGVDVKTFKSENKINNGKINIVTHHWSSNKMKGADVYDALDEFVGINSDKFTFTYIGRTCNKFKNTIVIPPLNGKKLGEELGRYDVYVSGSRYDAGPNHIIESLACKLPTYVHINGAGCVEFAGKDHVYDNVKTLINILATINRCNVKQQINTKFYPVSWEDCIFDYVKYFESILNV